MKLKNSLTFIFISLQVSLCLTAQTTLDLYTNASELFNQKKYNESLDIYNEIINTGVQEYNTFFRRSYCYYYLGQYQKALDDIEMAYNLAPKDPGYFYLKAQSYDKLKMFDLAEYYLDMAIKLHPQKLYYYKYRSAFQLEQGNYSKAEYDFDVLIEANPNDYKSYFGRGLARFNQKRKTEACLDWRYAKEYHQACNEYFFYKCGKVDLRSIEQDPIQPKLITPPEFSSPYDSTIEEYLSKKISYILLKTILVMKKVTLLPDFQLLN